MLKYIISVIISLILLLIISRYIRNIGLIYENLSGEREIVMRHDNELVSAGGCGESGKMGSGNRRDADSLNSDVWKNSSKDACSCKRACRKDGKCNSWEWKRVDGKPKCYFKDGYSLEETRDDVYGGVINSPPDENDPMAGSRNKFFTWSKDKLLKKVGNVNAQACASSCESNALCTAWAKCKPGDDCEGCYLLKDTYTVPEGGKGDKHYAGSKLNKWRGKYIEIDEIGRDTGLMKKSKDGGDLSLSSVNSLINKGDKKYKNMVLNNLKKTNVETPMDCKVLCDKVNTCKYWQSSVSSLEDMSKNSVCWLGFGDKNVLKSSVTDNKWGDKYFSGFKSDTSTISIPLKTTKPDEKLKTKIE